MQKEKLEQVITNFDRLYITDLYDEEDAPDGTDNEMHWDNLMYVVKADDVAYGASKVVFWFNDIKDYVIKVPIVGDYNDFDEEYEDYSHAYAGLVEYPDYEPWDYCGSEEEIYNHIKTNNPNLAKFFAAVFFLDSNRHNVPIYAAEKVDRTLCHARPVDTSDNSKNKAKDTCNTYGYIGGLSRYAMELFYDQYPEEDVNQLFDFIMENCIDDLHGANLGFNKDGKLVIIDYSSFNH